MTTRLPIDIVVTTTPTGTICLKGADAVATDVLSNDLLAISVGILLYRITGETRFVDDYDRLWEYSWKHLIDHQQGAWFRIRNRDGSEFDKLKSPPGKTDYHTMGACWDVLSQQP